MTGLLTVLIVVWYLKLRAENKAKDRALGQKLAPPSYTGKVETASDFHQRYPGSFRNGRFICPFCGGGGIWIERCHGAIDYFKCRDRSHRCRTCGKVLYYS